MAKHLRPAAATCRGLRPTENVLAAPPQSFADGLLTLCGRWMALDVEIDRLSLRWSALEGHFVAEAAWFQLNAAQRRALPGAAEMFEIEDRLEALSQERDKRLELLMQPKATDLREITAKLAVAARLLMHDDGPAQRLVADAVLALATHCHPRGGHADGARP